MIAGCAASAPPRPQLIVVIDTDAPLVGQLASPELAAAAAVDVVRIDVLGPNREVLEIRELVAPDARDWPLSFGIPSADGAPSTLTLRVRAFRAAWATSGSLGDTATLEPRTNVVIDRALELDLPAAGVQTVGIVLATACFGAPASFTTPARTCVDAARRDVSAREGLTSMAPAKTLVGSAPEALERPCSQESPAGARCIPGGLALLGDENTSLIGGGKRSPVRLVVVSPFHMDETEFTVGRYRPLVTAKRVKEPFGGSTATNTTWLGVSDRSNDALPVNYVAHSDAEAACAAVGGRLPTEAEWEHAARGRVGSIYPWGDEQPRCCSASYGRDPFDGICTGSGVEPVRSHIGKGCAGPADVSRDGIVDLAGSLAEATLDRGVPYTDACWRGPGLVTDPRCTNEDVDSSRGSRGGFWDSTGLGLPSSVRLPGQIMPSRFTGFRCVYDDLQ